MSMYILLVGVLCFCGMAVFANKVGFQSQFRAGASTLAATQMNVLKSVSYNNLADTTETAFTIPDSFVSQLPGGSNTKYQFQGTYSVATLTSTEKRLDVCVRWRNATTHEGSSNRPWSEVRLTTLITRPGSVTTR